MNVSTSSAPKLSHMSDSRVLFLSLKTTSIRFICLASAASLCTVTLKYWVRIHLSRGNSYCKKYQVTFITTDYRSGMNDTKNYNNKISTLINVAHYVESTSFNLAGAMQQRNCKDLLSACLEATSNGDSGFQNPGNFCLWNP